MIYHVTVIVDEDPGYTAIRFRLCPSTVPGFLRAFQIPRFRMVDHDHHQRIFTFTQWRTACHRPGFKESYLQILFTIAILFLRTATKFPITEPPELHSTIISAWVDGRMCNFCSLLTDAARVWFHMALHPAVGLIRRNDKRTFLNQSLYLSFTFLPFCLSKGFSGVTISWAMPHQHPTSLIMKMVFPGMGNQKWPAMPASNVWLLVRFAIQPSTAVSLLCLSEDIFRGALVFLFHLPGKTPYNQLQISCCLPIRERDFAEADRVPGTQESNFPAVLSKQLVQFSESESPGRCSCTFLFSPYLCKSVTITYSHTVSWQCWATAHHSWRKYWIYVGSQLAINNNKACHLSFENTPEWRLPAGMMPPYIRQNKMKRGCKAEGSQTLPHHGDKSNRIIV